MPPDLFFMEGEQWKQTRNIITPCFTAKKLKLVSKHQEIVASKFAVDDTYN